MCRGLITFTIRGRDLTIKGSGLFIPKTVVTGCMRYEIHQLKISTLSPSLTVVLDALNAFLEVALVFEIIRGQGHQEFPKEFYTILIPVLVALLLSLGHPLISCNGLSLYLDKGFIYSVFSASQASFSFSAFPSSACHQSSLVEGYWNSAGRKFAFLRPRQKVLTSRPLMPMQGPGKQRSMIS
ncbi:hypothetical protein Cgig2_011058 [Carnegiea gigantea]|uniref:Uncharacterized protein n=1 Tax=Carnegiea gigantea TaxID=171969 RepID=A0A9Q1JJV5_9CARY|nr:hypothetical protein Cgig2_011058 [Carnegiea gigantea]